MSELIQKNDNRATIRWKLLTGASAFALAGYILSANAAMAGDSDHPLLWIDLGANLDAVSSTGERFSAPFMFITPTPNSYKNGAPFDEEKPSRFAIGGDIGLTFQPEGSDWVFSAGIRYGRSHKRHDTHHQSTPNYRYPAPLYPYYHEYYPSQNYPAYRTSINYAANFADTKIDRSERHLIVDFQAGKDVGLGLFGHDGTSVLSGGVRVARFASHDDVKIRARPHVEFDQAIRFGVYVFPYKYQKFASYYLAGQASRSFDGIGPSLSWSASVPIAGDTHDGQLSLDWGINGAVLFGRQKAKVSHSTASYYFKNKPFDHFVMTTQVNAPPPQSRSRNVSVPNLGASVGITYRLQDAKISIGYRYDTFLNAMDTGIDATKKSNVTFNGPYASISIGLGD